MLFQTFDDKERCIALYAKEKLFFKKPPSKLTKTWSYSEFLSDKDVEYAQLYCAGKSLDQTCPDHLKKDWEKVSNKLKAFYRSALEAELDLNEHCFYDMVPQNFLIDYAEIKNKICAHVFSTHEKPHNYDHLSDLTKVLVEIKNKKLNVDATQLSKELHKFKVRRFVKKIKRIAPYIKYDSFRTKTGRLATYSNSFPILTMDKSYRKILKPKNDWFLEFDYNAAELRVMLGLLEKEQPKEDIHEWNLKNVYNGVGTREEAKKRIFAWLYNPESKDALSSKAYDRDGLLNKYWDGANVKTCFNREIEADAHHALNYIIQSTAADLFLRQMIEVWKLLKGRKSYITFCMHDSLVIDFSEEEQHLLNELKEKFENTIFGKFKVNSSAGKNYGEMKRLNVH